MQGIERENEEPSEAERNFARALGRITDMWQFSLESARDAGAGRRAYEGPSADERSDALDDVVIAGTLLWLDVAAREIADTWAEDVAERRREREGYDAYAAAARDDHDERAFREAMKSRRGRAVAEEVDRDRPVMRVSKHTSPWRAPELVTELEREDPTLPGQYLRWSVEAGDYVPADDPVSDAPVREEDDHDEDGE
jgi:hypothetical protein